MGDAVPDRPLISDRLRNAYLQAAAVLDARRADLSLSADLTAAQDLNAYIAD